MTVYKSIAEIPTIDCSLVTIETENGDEFGFDTANQIGVEPQLETTDAIKLIIKNKFSSNIDFDIQSVSNSPIDQKFLDTINRIIENNFDNPDFNVNILASELNVSRSSLYSKFEALTGMTPNDYVLQRKLKKASDLLKNNTELNISEISDSLGFGSPRYFSRCFKNHFGISPAEYKKG